MICTVEMVEKTSQFGSAQSRLAGAATIGQATADEHCLALNCLRQEHHIVGTHSLMSHVKIHCFLYLISDDETH